MALGPDHRSAEEGRRGWPQTGEERGLWVGVPLRRRLLGVGVGEGEGVHVVRAGHGATERREHREQDHCVHQGGQGHFTVFSASHVHTVRGDDKIDKNKITTSQEFTRMSIFNI